MLTQKKQKKPVATPKSVNWHWFFLVFLNFQIGIGFFWFFCFFWFFWGIGFGQNSKLETVFFGFFFGFFWHRPWPTFEIGNWFFGLF